MPTVTKYMLEKEFNQLMQNGAGDKDANPGTTGSTNTNTNNKENTKSNVKVVEKKFNKIKNNNIICKDGTQAEILNPLPNITYTCTARNNTKQEQVLAETLTAKILQINNKQYVIGFKGQSEQLELRIDMGTTELRLTPKYTYLKTKHLIINGREVHKT